MRAVALHDDVIVFVSRLWQTTSTAVRAGEEGVLIDSPVFPDELDALPEVLKQARFPMSGLLSTHADWDHLLGRLAFPEAPLGCGESTAARIGKEPGAAQRDLRRFDEEHYVERTRPLALGALQPLPIPGRLSLGVDRELELHPAAGHTEDGIAIFAPWAGVLVCGDYLSPVEIPVLSAGGSVEAYLATLERLLPLLDRAQTLIPGHGAPVSSAAARELLQEDRHYLQALAAGASEVALPPSRRSAAQRAVHEQNVSYIITPGGAPAGHAATPPRS